MNFCSDGICKLWWIWRLETSHGARVFWMTWILLKLLGAVLFHILWICRITLVLRLSFWLVISGLRNFWSNVMSRYLTINFYVTEVNLGFLDVTSFGENDLLRFLLINCCCSTLWTELASCLGYFVIFGPRTPQCRLRRVWSWVYIQWVENYSLSWALCNTGLYLAHFDFDFWVRNEWVWTCWSKFLLLIISSVLSHFVKQLLTFVIFGSSCIFWIIRVYSKLLPFSCTSPFFF